MLKFTNPLIFINILDMNLFMISELCFVFYYFQTSRLIRPDEIVFRAASYCHSSLTNPPNGGIQYITIDVSFLPESSTELQKQYIGFVVLSVITGIMIDKVIMHAEKMKIKYRK